MAASNRAVDGGCFARLRNATEAVIGYDCRAAGYGDTAIVVLREGRKCGSSEKKGREADNGLTHLIPLEGNLRSSHLRSGCCLSGARSPCTCLACTRMPRGTICPSQGTGFSPRLLAK